MSTLGLQARQPPAVAIGADVPKAVMQSVKGSGKRGLKRMNNQTNCHIALEFFEENMDLSRVHLAVLTIIWFEI